MPLVLWVLQVLFLLWVLHPVPLHAHCMLLRLGLMWLRGQGRFLAIAGFGNLPGDVALYDRKADGKFKPMGSARCVALASATSAATASRTWELFTAFEVACIALLCVCMNLILQA